MGLLLGLLALAAYVGAFVCYVIVLFKLFQTEGPLYGILGLICGVYTLIWGWMSPEKVGIKNIIGIWVGLMVGGLAMQILGIVLAAVMSGK